MNPVVTYQTYDNRGGRIEYLLYEDHLKIKWSTFQSDGEHSISLATLSHAPSIVRERGRWHVWFVFVVAAFISAVASAYTLPVPASIWAPTALSWVGVAALFRMSRRFVKRKHWQFRNRDGGIMFAIPAEGPRSERVDHFLDQLIHQIQVANQSKQPD